MTTGAGFIAGGGELGELIRTTDWGTTSVGACDAWPQSLRTAVSFVVESGIPMALVWGPERLLIYNDAFRPLVGDEHPHALARAADGVWSNANFIRSIDAVRTGESHPPISEGCFEFRRDGLVEKRVVNFAYSPIRVESGDIGGTLVVAHRVRECGADDASESKYQSILMTSADAIISIDDRRSITEWNQGAEKIFGYTRAEALGSSLERLLPVRHRAAHQGHVMQFARESVTARAMDHEAAVGMRKNGEEFPISATISRVEICGERIMTVAVRDISEQKRIESEQRVLAEVGGALASLDYEGAMAALPRALVGALADFASVLAIDALQFRRLGSAHVDPQVSERLAALPNPDLGHSLWQAFREHRPIQLELTPKLYEQVAKNPEHLRFLRTTRPTALLNVPLLALGNCVGILALGKSKGRFSERDVELTTEVARRIALFIENERAHAAEQRAIKARDEVLSVVAHDLRNPLNAIVLQSGLLRRRGAEPERRNLDPIDLIRRYAMRMNALVEDLLDVSQMDAGQMRLERKSVSIDTLIHEAALPHRTGLQERDISFEIAPLTDLPEVWADGGRVIQVLDNLIGNACKVVSRGRVSIGARLDGPSICVWVADTGPGVSAEDRPYVFDRFWQAGRIKHSGVGLGLAIVKGIVEAHAGRVWLESEPGQGSTFFFTLPLAAAAESARTGPTSGPWAECG